MISVGLSWKMAIGACVLGNTVMGLVITINGRMGATVGCVLLQKAERGLLRIASHSVPRSCTHAIWLLLQLLRRRVPLRPRHRLARVSLSDQSLHHFRRLTVRSVQTTTGGQCMTVLLTAIWPSFANIPNHIPAGEGITTAGMCGFVLYFLLQLPFLCIPYTKVQHFFAFKSVIAPIIFLAVFGDTLHKAGGTISRSTVITQGTTVSGSVLAWAFFGSK
jgi:nucleobase:cation symporter-1, NCS1 family